MFEPKFSITNQILLNIGNIEAYKALIDNSALIPAWEKNFQDEATLRTVHYGTHLEGNDLSLGQAKLIFENLDQKEAGNKPPHVIKNEVGISARDRDIQEIINYRKVLEYLDELRENTQRFTRYKESEFKRIHQLTMDKILDDSQAGEYRTSRVLIKDAASGNISFRPPLPVEVPFQMEHFLEWLNSFISKDIHPVLRAGITHFEIVRIHPFVDGNGRVARAIATLILFREGYDIRRLFALEEYYDRSPADYYQALQSVQLSDGDISQWLEYFTLGLAKELEAVREKVKRLSFDDKLLNRFGQQITLTNRQMKLVEYMREHEQMSMNDATRILSMVSEDTILRELRILFKKGLIIKIGKTKGVHYQLNLK